jgi:4-hydroxy-3-methylbut-2-enyl diphosphate reductase
LQEIAVSRGIRSFHIDTPERISADNRIEHKPLGSEELSAEAFLPAGPLRVGITSGASTPDRVVEDVIRRLMDLADA